MAGTAGRSAAATAAGGRGVACGVLGPVPAVGAVTGAAESLATGMASAGGTPPRAARTRHDGPTSAGASTV